MTAPQPEIPDVPLDESQTKRHGTAQVGRMSPADLLALNQTLALFHRPCDTCVAGSNGWAVSGSRTASGKPLLSNDMHLRPVRAGAVVRSRPANRHARPGRRVSRPWVSPCPERHLSSCGRHNQHVAGGFTNLGADVQDLFIEHTRGTPDGGAAYQTVNAACGA